MRTAICACVLLWTAESVSASAEVIDVSVHHKDGGLQLIIELTEEIQYRLFMVSDPERILLDLVDSRIATSIPTVFSRSIRTIRYGMPDDALVRMVVELTQPSRVKSFLLDPNDRHGYRLVVDIIDTDGQVASAKPIESAGGRDVLIAIDAGHGGKDHGATASGVHEKHLVLKYAKAMQREIDSRYGIKAVLIRDGDYFVSLRERMPLARRHQADLFLSLHANAFAEDSRIHGFIVFALSDQGASSEMGRWLAAKENAHASDSELHQLVEDEIQSKQMRKAILDLSMTSVLNQSMAIGNSILKQVAGVTTLHSDQVETADFAVLKALDLPALLVEMGFISNTKEAKKLADRTFRRKLILAMVDGIEAFYRDNPPPHSKFAHRRDENKMYYTVQKGDTLSAIATARQVPLAKLRRLNNLTDDRILVGQTLRLGSQSQSPIYKVQAGDSLWIIARQNGLTINQLMDFNGLEKPLIRPGQQLYLRKR